MATPWPIVPVTGIEVYKNDVRVIRKGDARPGVDWVRSEVKTFSRASRQRLAFIAANTDIVFTSMLTLTYPREFPSDGRTVKRNLNQLLTELRKRVPGVAYLWFLEFQRRGAPHVHLLIRGLRVHKATQRWVSDAWYRICATGDERHLRAGTRLERIRKPMGARNYAVKYAFKMKQKVVPPGYRNVGRFWGCSKGVKPQPKQTVQCTNDDLVGALEAGGWRWLHGDVIAWSVLYGAGECLTKWLNRCILDPRASSNRQPNITNDLTGGKQDGETIGNAVRRVWPHDQTRVRNGNPSVAGRLRG